MSDVIPPQEKLDEEVHGAADACPNCGELGQRWGQKCPKCGRRFFGNRPDGSISDAPVKWLRP